MSGTPPKAVRQDADSAPDTPGRGPASETPRKRLYGRRQGHRLSARQQHLMDTLLPRLTLPPGTGLLQPSRLFPDACGRVALEIGFGGGEHLAWQAAARPDWGFIGCEPFVNGMAQALSRIDAAGLANVRLHMGDARAVLARLPDGALHAVYVLFPDPWPKKRHWRRRFIGPDTMAALARVLVSGGHLRVASDIPDYVRWTLRHVLGAGAFEWTAEAPSDWRVRPSDWPPTRYEAKALRAGRTPAYLSFRRVAAPNCALAPAKAGA